MMRRTGLLTATISTFALGLASCSNGQESDQAESAAESARTEARVYIASPADGATVTSPVTINFGIDNFLVAPAGTFEPGTGHHHLLVDTDLPPLGQPIPSDENHLHFGKGQTETSLELAPGKHTLQLLLGDGAHVPHSDALISERITITVE